MNTATVHHPSLDWVFDMCRMLSAPQKGGTDMIDIDRADVPEEKLLAYIQDIIPAMPAADVLDLQAWKCPEQALPLPMFEQGALVVWNDKYIAPTHGARTSFKDDEPFTVSIVDDFLIAFTCEEGKRDITEHPQANRIALETPSGRIIIAHPGYFKLFRG